MRLMIGFMLLGLLAVLTVPVAASSSKDGRTPRRSASRKRIKRATRARRPASKSRLSRREPAA